MKQNSIENKCENTSIILPFNLGRSKVPSCTPSKYIANRNDAQEMRKQLNSKGIKEQQIYEMSGELDGIALFEQMAGRI